MELHAYWSIIRRRWILPVGLTLAALIASTAVSLVGASAFRTDMRLAVSTLPTVNSGTETYYDPVYYSNLNSEYLADDLSEVIKSESFAADVNKELGSRFDPAQLAEITRTNKTHRLIDVTINTSTPDEGAEIAAAMTTVINDPARISLYLKALDAYRGTVSVVNQPITRPAKTPIGFVTEVGLRTLVGLVLGLGLAFLADYLDQTVRNRKDIEEQLDLPILGEIPLARKGALA